MLEAIRSEPENRIRTELEDVFRRVFHNDDLAISDATTSADVDGWDSMAHVNLIVAIEKRFGIKFTSTELGSMQGDGQAVGHLYQMLSAKVGRASGEAGAA